MSADQTTRRPATSPGAPLAETAAPLAAAGGTATPMPPAGTAIQPAAPPPITDQTVISKRPPMAAGAVPFGGSPMAMGGALIGRRLEHYELNEFVGGGGMGAVFRATDTRLGRTVAVKVLSRDQGDEETIRRFRNEAQSAARLDHPNIARVYYVGEDQGLNFIVFEFIEGINLRDEVHCNGPLDLERAIYYTLQLAEALSHSSSRDVVHRDIKPSNVLVTAQGQVKLVDMGLARLHQVEAPADDLTATGVTLGTFDYISPEQARDPRAADVRSDIYSLGCTLFYMLTAQPPFPEGTALQKLIQHNSDSPPDVRLFRPEISPRVAQMLARMLAKRPSQRHQTPGALIADLIAIGDQLGFKTVADYGRLVVVPMSASGELRNKAWQMVAAAALLVIGIVAMEAVLSPREAGGGVGLRTQFRKASDAAATDNVTEPSDAQRDVERPEASVQPLAELFGPALPLTTPSTARSASSSRDVTATSSEPDAAATASTSDSASRPTAQESGRIDDAAAWRLRRLVVLGDSPSPPEAQTDFVNSLTDAAALAAERGVTEIELRYNGVQEESPLELPHVRLTVRAASGYRPAIVFRPASTSINRQMLRIAGGNSAHVAFEGVDLRMDLAADLLADGWSLFAIGTGQSLDLKDCVLTVDDGDMMRAADRDQVSMIAVQRRRSSDTMTMADPQLAMGQQAHINMERVFARGEASLVNVIDETPLTLRWNQGLLVSSKHLIETGGSAAEPQYYEQIVLDLDFVTACCRQGLYSVHRGNGKSHQFRIVSYADQCVFVSDAGAPLFEIIGLATPPDNHELQSTGEGNRFSPADMPFLFVRTNPMAEPQVFKLGRNWSSETRSQAGVPWLHPPSFDQPPHAAAKNGYLIDSDIALGSAGFDPLLVPDPAPQENQRSDEPKSQR
jgi:protein kinase-like protein